MKFTLQFGLTIQSSAGQFCPSTVSSLDEARDSDSVNRPYHVSSHIVHTQVLTVKKINVRYVCVFLLYCVA